MRDEVMKDPFFADCKLPASKGAALGQVTKLSSTTVIDGMTREIAGRSPDAVRGANQLAPSIDPNVSRDSWTPMASEICPVTEFWIP